MSLIEPNLGKTLVKGMKNVDFENITSSAVQDSAARSAASTWDLEVETGDAHDGDKAGASVAGKLTRKDGRGSTVSPFPSGK